MLDQDGTLCSVSGQPGQWAHSYDDCWWPCHEPRHVLERRPIVRPGYWEIVGVVTCLTPVAIAAGLVFSGAAGIEVVSRYGETYAFWMFLTTVSLPATILGGVILLAEWLARRPSAPSVDRRMGSPLVMLDDDEEDTDPWMGDHIGQVTVANREVTAGDQG